LRITAPPQQALRDELSDAAFLGLAQRRLAAA